MSSLSPARRRLVALLVIVASFAVVPAANAAGTFTNPKDYYVALGDSLAFGYQGAKVAACASTGCANPNAIFNTGYVDDFAAAMHRKGENPEQVVNFGCPGETSTTLLTATNATTGCQAPPDRRYPFPIHQNHPGKTQIAAAVAFLKAHANATNPITFNIGANDLLTLIQGCLGDATCISNGFPATLNTVATNATIALAQLRAAAPRSKIIVLGLYNPALNLLPASDNLTQYFNSVMSGVAASAGATFADPFQTINHGAAYPDEFTSVCSQIAVCTPSQDVHPFDNGYQAIADVIFGVSGF